MEKVRYGENIFELVPGGFDLIKQDKLTIRHQKGEKTLDQIKAIAKSVTASDSIDLLNSDGEMIRSLDGYVYAGDIRDIEDYLVEETHVEVSGTGGLAEGQEPEYTTEEVRADIAVVVFRLPDIHDELEDIKSVQEDMLVAMLEGGN